MDGRNFKVLGGDVSPGSSYEQIKLIGLLNVIGNLFDQLHDLCNIAFSKSVNAVDKLY